jgi:hypothetical protein
VRSAKRASLALLAFAAACRPGTTRPYFGPVTGAPQQEVELEAEKVTDVIAGILRDDSIPLHLVAPRDGYLETPWFNPATHAVSHARPLGLDAVRMRIWVDPSRPGFSRITAETIYRPVADPSLDPRQLDRQIPPDQPVAQRVVEILDGLVKLYGPAPSTPNNNPAP